MKSLLTIIFIIGFIGITVFGFAWMHHGMQNHDGECIAAIALNVDCPKQASLINYLVFHLNAFKSFSLAAFGENLLNPLLFVLASLLFVGFFSSSLIFISPLGSDSSRYKFKNYFSPPQKQKLAHWLALYENSPTVS
ncbi:MAG: hypothetical protein QMD50_02785 [Patescibacteria group bacterium]|nr:hypothetical protein [Patescibacteria group bacterium]